MEFLQLFIIPYVEKSNVYIKYNLEVYKAAHVFHFLSINILKNNNIDNERKKS